MATFHDLAQILFPHVQESVEDLLLQYPPRVQTTVTRIAPSPTGFFHIGNLFTAIVNERIAHQDKGIFFRRVEDTDQARKVDGAIEAVVDNMKVLGLAIDEGPLGENYSDIGKYGPYTQSERLHLYHIFAKYLVEKGLAYPCRMPSTQLESIREEQMKTKKAPGIYGNYSLWRNKSVDEYIQQYQEDKNCVLRFRSPGDLKARVVFEDLNRGKVSMNDNYNDHVLLKSGLGLPTYHLAHIVDDTLMRTTLVIRGEERLTSVPLHLQLFDACDLPAPQYCHLPLILKLDNGKKRKVSKRHDPEFNIAYLYEAGFSPEGLIMFVLTLIDSGYEERQKNHPDAHYSSYRIDLERMNSSGMLWDTDKLKHINNIYLSKISNDQLFDEVLNWAQSYKADFAMLLQSDPDYALAAMSIERHTKLDPKRFNTYADTVDQVSFFFDDYFEQTLAERPELPFMMTQERAQEFLTLYRNQLDLEMTTSERFDQLKAIGQQLGFAANNQEFKNGNYIGKVGDLAMWIRIKLTNKKRTADLYSMMQVMGRKRILERLAS